MDAVTVGVMQGLSPEAAALVAHIKSAPPSYLPAFSNFRLIFSSSRENVKLAQTLGACGFAVCLWDTLAYLHIEYRVVWVSRLAHYPYYIIIGVCVANEA